MHPSIGVLSSNTDGFLYFYDAVKKDNLRFNLDTANQFVMKENLSLSLRRLAHFIDYIHLSDNRGLKVEHLKAGDGAINWDSFFSTLAAVDYQGYIGMDVGGAESGIADLDGAYVSTAAWLEEMDFLDSGTESFLKCTFIPPSTLMIDRNTGDQNVRMMPGRIHALRWWIGGLLFLSTVINYLDRQTLSVLAPF